MLKGFASEVFDSQKVFRQLLAAMANPGRIMDIGIDLESPEFIHPAAGAILLALLDFETPLWSDLENDSKEIQWLRFHTGAPYAYAKRNALFALQTDYDALESVDQFNPGTLEAPHQSTTLIVHTRGVDNNGRIRLTGPGIQTDRFLKLKGIKESFLHQRTQTLKDYPLGVDLIFVWDHYLVSIPRTTSVEIL